MLRAGWCFKLVLIWLSPVSCFSLNLRWYWFLTRNTLTVTLSFVLARSRTGFRKTDTIINRIIRGAVQTGLFASLFALADMFSFLLHRNTNLYAMFAFPLGRIYTNVRVLSLNIFLLKSKFGSIQTLLDTLNARTALKGATSGDSDSNNVRKCSILYSHPLKFVNRVLSACRVTL